MFGRYLHKTSSGRYRFRMRVPAELQYTGGRAEIRQSLHTDSLEEALALAAALGARYKLEFLSMRKKRKATRPLPDGNLSTGLITMLMPSGRELRVDYGGDNDRETKVFGELYENIAATDAKYAKPPETQSEPVSVSPMLSCCIESYLNEQRLRGAQDKSISDYKSALSDFIELHGDVPVAEVIRESVVNVVQLYAFLPSNRKKKRRYRDLPLTKMSLEELQDTDTVAEEDRMSATNVGKFITRASQLFNWVVTAEHRTTNPAKGLLKPKSTERKREPFSDEELRQIFESEDYRQNRFTSPYQFWTPLIALLSGARINEICQLRTKDIVTIDNILCFRITGEAGRIKNYASDRAVPIHSKLIELGLSEFVESQLKKGETRLFPELSPGRDGSGQTASKWFRRFRVKIGVSADTKTFHSFRHTVSTRLSYARCQDYEIGDVLGHKQQGMTTGTYRKTFPVTELRKTIEKLKFDFLWPPAPAYRKLN